QLLWHGSRLTNWYGILLHGLRIAPPEAPTTGYMFGKGVYAADCSSKSANYCYPQQGIPGLMVLSEFALGETRDLFDADYDASDLPEGKHSTRGLGGMGPDPADAVMIEDDLKVPCGKLVEQSAAKEKETSLLYNEYVVYDTKQIRMRYLVEVDFLYESLL
ncbi:WGR domain containing protein, partial [Aphelenchoides avenae]